MSSCCTRAGVIAVERAVTTVATVTIAGAVGGGGGSGSLLLCKGRGVLLLCKGPGGLLLYEGWSDRGGEGHDCGGRRRRRQGR